MFKDVQNMKVMQSNKNFDILVDALDDSQRECVLSDEPNIIIKAPAGSGKTYTAIMAIANYRYNHINDSISAITFTNAAAKEMVDRLNNLGIYDVSVGTIHAWCASKIKQICKKHQVTMSVLQEWDIKDILSDLVVDYVKRSKRIRSINVDILYQFVSGNKKMDITDNYKRTLVALEDRYIKYKRENALYDFTDFPQYLYDIMTAYNEEINDIDALFVDEFQDVDPVQLKIFEKVNANKKLYIGDEWQSIYGFRGCDGEAFSKLKDFTKYKLKYNYRSYQEIIDYASTVYQELYCKEGNRYITSIKKIDPSPVKCVKKYGGSVTVVDPWNHAVQFGGGGLLCQANYNVDWQQELKEMLLNDNATILCRTNKQVKQITNGSLFNAETIHQAKGLEYDNVIVIDSEILNDEDMHVAYVALTRAKNKLLIINWSLFEQELYLLNKQKRFGVK